MPYTQCSFLNNYVLLNVIKIVNIVFNNCKFSVYVVTFQIIEKLKYTLLNAALSDYVCCDPGKMAID